MAYKATLIHQKHPFYIFHQPEVAGLAVKIGQAMQIKTDNKTTTKISFTISHRQPHCDYPFSHHWCWVLQRKH